MMCVVPGWIGLDRAYAEWERMDPAERARHDPLIPPADIVAVVLDLIRDGAAGTVVEIHRPGRLVVHTEGQRRTV